MHQALYDGRNVVHYLYIVSLPILILVNGPLHYFYWDLGVMMRNDMRSTTSGEQDCNLFHALG